MSSKNDLIKPQVALGREARLASIVSFSKALSALAAAGVLVSGCYGQYSYPTGAYPANYRYQTTYVAHPKVYYDYNQWPRLGYPYGRYGTQGIRY